MIDNEYEHHNRELLDALDKTAARAENAERQVKRLGGYPSVLGASHDLLDQERIPGFLLDDRVKYLLDAYRRLRDELASANATRSQAEESLRRVEVLEALLAWQHEVLSEGQVCRLLDMAPVDVREALMEAIVAVQIRWAKWRESNPPSPS